MPGPMVLRSAYNDAVNMPASAGLTTPRAEWTFAGALIAQPRGH